MRSKSEVIADFQIAPVLEGLIFAIRKEGAKLAAVYNVGAAQVLVERHLLVRPTSLSISRAFAEGVTYGVWKILDSGNSMALETQPFDLELVANSLSHEDKTVYYALEKSGPAAFKGALAEARARAVKTYNEAQSLGYDIGSDASFDRLRQHLRVVAGLHKSRGSIRPILSRPRAVDWTKWGTILTAMGIIVTIAIWYSS